MTRPGLDKPVRQVATIAALMALGAATAKLKAHIQGALSVRCTPQHITECILQMVV